ncbi:MAG TPA: VWA domain-containing protein [Pyrinomonadaceae bacterium]|nr:VWA domain-containing protein [Pyrinomonadaceae bacterium]
MTKQRIPGSEGRAMRVFMFLGMIAILVAGLLGSNYIPEGRTQETRLRRSGQAATQRPTATPTPRTPTTTSQPATPTQVPQPAATLPAVTQTPTTAPTATPTPVPQTNQGVDRIAPGLGEPPPIPKLKPKPTPTPPEEFGEGEVVRVDTELVTLNVRVIDRNNRPIDNVRENEMHVFEDGVEQPIESFSREEVPISYGLAVDTSGSLRSQLQSVIDAGKSIINTNKPGDETFLVRFISSDKIETVQDFTSNQDLLIEALDSLYVEGGQTAVIDAVYLSAERLAEYKKGDDNDRRRRALIVVTDGEDRVSFYKQEQLFARLREQDVQIYVIGFVNELDKEGGFIRKSPRDRSVNLINKLASETGGRAFFPDSIADLPQIANEIVRDLRTQYVVAYNPTNKARDGSYRIIRIGVADTGRDKRIALTRSGRTAPRGPAPTPRSTPPPPRTRLPAANKP